MGPKTSETRPQELEALEAENADLKAYLKQYRDNELALLQRITSLERERNALLAAKVNELSRTEIASKIIGYLEILDSRTRQAIEASMRVRPRRASDRKDFVSKWEKIIKGIEL